MSLSRKQMSKVSPFFPLASRIAECESGNAFTGSRTGLGGTLAATLNEELFIAKKVGCFGSKKRKRHRNASISSLRRSQKEHQTNSEEAPMKYAVKGMGHALEETARAKAALLRRV